MIGKRIYADFNSRTEDGYVRLDCVGAMRSLKATPASAGEWVWLYDDDLDVGSLLVERDGQLLAHPVFGMRPKMTIQEVHQVASSILGISNLCLLVRNAEGTQFDWFVYLLLHNYPNQLHGTMVGSEYGAVRPFDEPITGTWLALKGPSLPKRPDPYAWDECEQFVRGEGDTVDLAALDALQKVVVKLREDAQYRIDRGVPR